jgi:DNA invertase Pin-like site-specific DNA recombinase
MASTRPLAYSYIRISSDQQLRGDSLRRQLEASRRYADEHDLELVEDMRDLGVSGFTGANVAEGALGRFLAAIRAGKVPKGSYVIVENLDRFSRQDPHRALVPFLEMIHAGLSIVTLTDGKVYTSANLSTPDLIMSILIMGGANEQSKVKSERIGKAWSTKRKNAASRPLTAKCPPWLRLKKDRSGFEVIESKARIIRRIFDESAAGIGAYKILHRLNRERTPHLSDINGWSSSYVCKLLKNRAVLGEFQPFEYIKTMPGEPRRRRPDGDPVPGYFPAIVDEDTFDAVRAGLQSRRNRGGRKGGKFLRNIFSGFIQCAYCQSPMKFKLNGVGYLVCDHAARGVGQCKRVAWNYNDFEASFISFVKEFDLVAVVDGEAEVGRRRMMEDQVTALRGKLAAIEDQRDRTYELFLNSGHASDFVGRKLNELETKRAELATAIKAKQEELAGLEHDRIAVRDIRPLIEMMQTQDGDEKIYKLRSQVASRLRSLVSTIEIAPAGQKPLVVGSMKKLTSDQRYFFVTFVDDNTRCVYPDPDDPLKVTHQVVNRDDVIQRLDSEGKAVQTIKFRRREGSYRAYSGAASPPAGGGVRRS